MLSTENTEQYPNEQNSEKNGERRIVPAVPAANLPFVDRQPLPSSAGQPQQIDEAHDQSRNGNHAPPRHHIGKQRRSGQKKQHRHAQRTDRCESQHPYIVEGEIEFLRPFTYILTHSTPNISHCMPQRSSRYRYIVSPPRSIPAKDRYSHNKLTIADSSFGAFRNGLFSQDSILDRPAKGEIPCCKKTVCGRKERGREFRGCRPDTDDLHEQFHA